MKTPKKSKTKQQSRTTLRPNNNDAVVDLRKVQWATMHYENQHGDRRKYSMNCYYTVHNEYIHTTVKVFGSNETMLDYAKRKGLLDVWTSVCTLNITANRRLRYTGDKARSIWDAWCARMFGGNK